MPGLNNARLDEMLRDAGVSARRRRRAGPVSGDPPPAGAASPVDAGVASAATSRRSIASAALFFVVAQVASTLFTVVAFARLGTGVIDGERVASWVVPVAAWLGAAGTALAASVWASTWLGTAIGSRQRARLVDGVLALDPDRVRRHGSASLLSSLLEVATIESAGLDGGLVALIGAFEAVAGVVVLLIADAWWASGVWLVGAVVVGVGTVTLARRRQQWTAARHATTGPLVERMQGHRTELVYGQARPYGDQAQALDAYERSCRRLDWVRAAMIGGVAPALLLAGLAAAWGDLEPGADSARVAALLGGLLLSVRGFAQLADGLDSATTALAAYRWVRPLTANLVAGWPTEPVAAGVPAPARDGDVVVEAESVTFAHAGRAAPVLAGIDLTVRVGDRVLIEGPSGGGKTTLATVLAGLRAPLSGTVRRGASAPVLVPQHGENHLFQASLAFNLLFGRCWPPRSTDLADAETVLRELGLGELLDRMPAGLGQPVGECGWRLSQGERARIYLARALLQAPGALILDETLAPLDPNTLRVALAALDGRVPTQIVIAHP